MWIYKNKVFDITPDDKVGFVYMITEIDTGRIYIGIKKFWKTVKLKPLKGKKNKRHRKRESDWRDYNSSSEYLKEMIPKRPGNYKKEILILCDNITEMKLFEAYIQIDMWLNGYWDYMINGFIGLKLKL